MYCCTLSQQIQMTKFYDLSDHIYRDKVVNVLYHTYIIPYRELNDDL